MPAAALPVLPGGSGHCLTPRLRGQKISPLQSVSGLSAGRSQCNRTRTCNCSRLCSRGETGSDHRAEKTETEKCIHNSSLKGHAQKEHLSCTELPLTGKLKREQSHKNEQAAALADCRTVSALTERTAQSASSQAPASDVSLRCVSACGQPGRRAEVLTESSLFLRRLAFPGHLKVKSSSVLEARV